MSGRAGRRSRAAKPLVCMPRARTKLEPGERLLLASRPHPAALLPALLRALGAVLAAAIVLALLARSSAPDARAPRARPARARVRRARRAALHARRLAVGSHAARADDAPRLRGRSARCRAPRLGDDAARPASTAPASATASRGRLLGYGTLTLGDGPQGRDVRFVSDAERIAEAILEAEPHTAAPGRRSRGRLSLISRPLVRASRDRGRIRRGSSIGLLVRLRGRAGPGAREPPRAGPASRPRSDARARA